MRFRVHGASGSKAGPLLRRQLDLNFVGDGACNLTLQSQRIAKAAVVFLGPELPLGDGLRQVDGHPYPVSVTFDCALQYGVLLTGLGRNDEAVTQVNQAIGMDPLSSLYRNWLAAIAYVSGQYDLAIKLAENLSDEWAFSLALPYAKKRMYPEAIANFEKSIARTGRQTDTLGYLALVYGLAGRKEETQKIISELKERSRHHYVFPSVFAHAYLGLGDKDRALTFLEQAYDEQDPALFYLKAEPLLDPLRSEPRFQALLRRVNLQP